MVLEITCYIGELSVKCLLLGKKTKFSVNEENYVFHETFNGGLRAKSKVETIKL